MSDLRESSRNRKLPQWLVSGMAMIFVTASAGVLAQVSEIDSYDRAVTSQTKEAALAFLEDFRSSHLVGDLIESLRPDVAREVCASLPSGVSRARRACEQLRSAAVTEAPPGSRNVAGPTQPSVVAAPTQPIQTQPIEAMPSSPATTGASVAAPDSTAPAAGGQSEVTAPGTPAAHPTSMAAGSAPFTSGVSEPAAIAPPTPIKSRPTVYVRPDSAANIRAQAMESSVVVGTVSGNTPLTVVGRDRSWLKILVPGAAGQEGWVHTSALQSDAGGVKVGPASAAISPAVTSSSPTQAPAPQVATSTSPAIAPTTAMPSVAPAAGGQSEISAPATAAADPTSVAPGSAPFTSGAWEAAAIAPPTPIKSRPTVYVRPDSAADIRAQAMESSVVVGTVSGNTPLTVVGRDRSWLKILVPGTAGQEGWVHTSALQSDAGGIKVGPASAAMPTPATSSSPTQASAPQVATLAVAPAAAMPSAVPVVTDAANFPPAGPVVRIWLASLKSRELAERDWRDLQAAYGPLLADLEPTVRQVDLGPEKGGIWYRIYAGPLASRDKARALCAEIKSQPPKSNCLIVVE